MCLIYQRKHIDGPRKDHFQYTYVFGLYDVGLSYVYKYYV